MTLAREVGAVARLELADVLRSRWLLFSLAVYLLLGLGFVLIGMRESGVVGFTGMGRVLFGLSHALVFLLPLLGLGATGQVVNGARDDGTLELLFGHPLRRAGYFTAVTVVRVGVLVVPLLVLLPLLAIWGAVGFDQAIPWAFLLRALAVCIALLCCSVALGLLVSTFVRNQSKALIALIALWAAGVALIDFGLIGAMLQWQIEPVLVFALAALNPVQDARLALLSVAEPELATLGPVGFYLANHVGATGLLAIGIGWPLLLGAAAWTLTLQRFCRGDLL